MKINILKYLHSNRCRVKSFCNQDMYRQWKGTLLIMYSRFMEVDEDTLEFITFGYTDAPFLINHLVFPNDKQQTENPK